MTTIQYLKYMGMEFVRTQHSIIDTAAVACIHQRAIVYALDFKLDRNPVGNHRLPNSKRLGKKGCFV